MQSNVQAKQEHEDFVRRARESLDNVGQVQFDAALRYLAGREDPAQLDKASIVRRHKLLPTQQGLGQ